MGGQRGIARLRAWLTTCVAHAREHPSSRLHQVGRDTPPLDALACDLGGAMPIERLRAHHARMLELFDRDPLASIDLD